MGTRASMRLRLTGAAFLMALVTGCGGGGGDAGLVPEPPAPPPVAPPAEPPVPGVLTLGEFPAARVVIGQSNFESGDPPPSLDTPLDRLNLPEGNPALTDDGRLFVAAGGGVSAFRNYDATTAGSAADFRIVAFARSASVHGGKFVYLADNEVRIFDAPPAAGDAQPAVTVGGAAGCAANRLRAPRGAFITPKGKLIVADTDNHRVMIWNQIPTSGENADVVLGQESRISCNPNNDGSASELTLFRPTSVWSDDDKLVVVDKGNHRVLIWTAFPVDDFEPATRVLGQQDGDDTAPNAGQPVPSGATLLNPETVDVRPSGKMAVADSGNHRVLVWDAFPAEDFQAANQVIGQEDFTANAANAGGNPGANTLRTPVGVRFDGRNLVVVDKFNNRVLVFRSTN